MKKTFVIILAIIVAIVMLALAGFIGILVGYSAGEDDGSMSGYDLGYDACMAKIMGDVWLVEVTEKTIKITDRYLDGKIDAGEACNKIESIAEMYIGNKDNLETGFGNILQSGINAIYYGIHLTTYDEASEEDIAEYNTKLLETRNFVAKNLGMSER